MNTTSMKRALGLAAAAASTSGAMMLTPAVANAATAHPAHVQTVSNASRASVDGGFFPFFHHCFFFHHFFPFFGGCGGW